MTTLGTEGASRIFMPTEGQAQRSPLLAAAAALRWTEEQVIAELFKAHEHLERSLIRIAETTACPVRFVVPPGLTPENALADREHLNSMAGDEAMCAVGLIPPPEGSYGVTIELEPRVRGGAWLRFAPNGYLAPHEHDGADERCILVEGEVSFKSSPTGDSWEQMRGGVGHAKTLGSFGFLGGFLHAIRAGEAGVAPTLHARPAARRCSMSTDPFVDLEQTVAALRAQARPAGPDGPYVVALDIEADGIERAVAALRPAYAMLHGEREAALDLAVLLDSGLREAAGDLAAVREERDAARKERDQLAGHTATMRKAMDVLDALVGDDVYIAVVRALADRGAKIAALAGEIQNLLGAASRPPLTAEEVHRRVEASRDEAKQIVDEHLDAMRSRR